MNISLDPLRPYADMARWAAALLLALLILALGYRWGADRWQDKFNAEAQARVADNERHAATIQRLAEATKAAEARARAATDALAENRQVNDTRYNEALDNAKRAQRDLAAALRRGDVQLRPEWSCAAAGPGAGGTAPFARGQDAAAELRWAGATHLVAGSDRADAWIVWLQRELIDTRQAVVAAGCAVEASIR